MRLSKLLWGSSLNPSSAAQSLLSSISLPVGAVTVWPTTRDGQIKLVVRLDLRFWDYSKNIPVEFEGFDVIIEPNRPLSAQSPVGLATQQIPIR